MQEPAIASTRDSQDFIRAFNNHDWESVTRYMTEDCVWDASEKRLTGRKSIVEYWTNYHASFRETLGKPEKIVFGDHEIYLQVRIRLDFLEDGSFFGTAYKKGDVLEFGCADSTNWTMREGYGRVCICEVLQLNQTSPP
jgi:nuclear transport factor 2 (NTF2) superfamily protein